MDKKWIELAEYSHSHDLFPTPVDIEYDDYDNVFPEAVRNGKRFCDYMAAQPIETYEGAQFMGLMRFTGKIRFPGEIHGLRGHEHSNTINRRYYLVPQENVATHDWEHATADFGFAISHGLNYLLDQVNVSREKHCHEPEKVYFLTGVELALSGMLAWAERCANKCEEWAQSAPPARAEELRVMADTLRRVPKLPARTFREGIQMLYMLYHFMPDSPGSPDRYLRKLYEDDLAAGRLTREEASNYIAELAIMFSARTVYSSGAADKGGECHMTLGGYLPDHTDGWCDLSALILDTIMQLPLVRPQMTVRWTPELDKKVFYHVLDCERKDKGKRIALCNDVPRINAYMKYADIPFEEACRYVIVGCNEPTFEGAIDLTGTHLCVGPAVVDVFHGDRRVFDTRSFDEFYNDFFEPTLFRILDRGMNYLNMFNAARAQDINVVSSPFLRGCIENGLSVTQGGASLSTTTLNLVGYVSVVDSLAVIKSFVFDSPRFTLKQLSAMCDADWQGFEKERKFILSNARFFGNDDDSTADLAALFNASLASYVKNRRGIFGTRLICGSFIGYQPHNVLFGERVAATPDGRHNGEPFVVGISQADGKDRGGLTALLNSVATVYADGILSGSVVTNLTLDEKLIKDDTFFPRTVEVFDNYFRNGGLMLQLNYVSREQLLDAKAHPEKHAGLRVRVSGFSAYFTRLNPSLQDDVIARTEKSM